LRGSGSAAYALIWSVGGVSKEFVLKGRPYFIGRPSLTDMAALAKALKRRPTPLDVLIYPARPPLREGDAAVTGFRSAAVSRRHVKLVPEGGALRIVDHGPEGRGSRNGTFMNGVRLGRGEAATLREGCVLRLASSGPTFLVGIVAGGSILLRVPAGVPVDLPASVARGLRGSGATLEVQELGDAAVAVLKAGVFRDTASGLVVEARAGPDVEGLKRRYRVLTDMLHTLHTALEALRSGDVRSAEVGLRRLKMDVYSRVLEEVGDEELIRAYEDLIIMLEHGGIEYVEALSNRLELLCGMVKAAIDSL